MLNYRVENQQNTDTTFMIGTVCLKCYSSRVFVYLKHFCTSNQPQPLRENVRRPQIDQYNDRKECRTSVDFKIPRCSHRWKSFLGVSY